MAVYDRTFGAIGTLLANGAKRVPKTLLYDFKHVFGFGTNGVGYAGPMGLARVQAALAQQAQAQTQTQKRPPTKQQIKDQILAQQEDLQDVIEGGEERLQAKAMGIKTKLNTVQDLQEALAIAATHHAKVSVEFKEFLLENQDKFKPKFVNGHWRKAEFPAQKRRILRRQAERLGIDVPVDEPDKRNERIIKFKGHKWERAKEEKEAKIKSALETMDSKIEAYHKTRRDYRKELSNVQILFRLPDPKKQALNKPKKGGGPPPASATASA